MSIIPFMSFGKWLAEKRETAGLTQKQLADRCGEGISASYISALEREEPNTKDDKPRQPRIDKVDRIAKALHVPIDEARLEAGYASKTAFHKPANAAEFVAALEALGVEHFEFAHGPEELIDMTPEDFANMLDAVRIAVEITIARKKSKD